MENRVARVTQKLDNPRDKARFPDLQAWRKAVEDAGYFIGPNRPGNKQTDNINAAYNWATGAADPKEFQTALRGERKYAAAVQLALENADFIGNDRASKTAILCRTESFDTVVDRSLKRGDVSNHKRGVNESHSHWRAVTVFGSAATMIRVPYPRVSGLYFAERRVGDPDQGQFAGDEENEITADTHGLTAIYMGDTSRPFNTRLETHHDDFKKFEQQAKGGKP